MTDQPHDNEAREAAMRAFWAEMDRQCAMGAGTAETNSETGLLVVHADIDPFGMAEAMIAFARSTPAPAQNGREAFPERIGQLQLGERLSDGDDRMCAGGCDQPIPAGHAVYWPERLGEYPDDMDSSCISCAIDKSEREQGWCECDAAALARSDSARVEHVVGVPCDLHPVFSKWCGHCLEVSGLSGPDDAPASGIRINGKPATVEDVIAVGRAMDAEDGGYPLPTASGGGDRETISMKDALERLVDALRPFMDDWNDMGVPESVPDEKLMLDADGVGGEIITVGHWRALVLACREADHVRHMARGGFLGPILTARLATTLAQPATREDEA